MKTCVNSIIQSSHYSKLQVELLLIDNSSEKKTFDFDLNPKDNFCHCKILHSLPGANTARNFGLKMATSNIVLFVDDDCIIEDMNFLMKHLDFHLQNNTVLGAGGFYTIPSSAGMLDRFYVSSQMEWLERARHSDTYRMNFLIGGNMSVKKNIIFKNKIFFDEALKYGGTETDFFMQVFLKNLECYLIDAPIVHCPDLNLYKLCRKSYKQGEGKKYRELKFSKKLTDKLYISPLKIIENSKTDSFLKFMQKQFFNLGYNRKITLLSDLIS